MKLFPHYLLFSKRKHKASGLVHLKFTAQNEEKPVDEMAPHFPKSRLERGMDVGAVRGPDPSYTALLPSVTLSVSILPS